MEERRIREEKIKKVLTELLASSGLRSEELFQSLCLYLQESDIDFISRAFTRQADSESVYWLVRYLVNIERPLGFEKLFELAASDSDFVREEAVSGIAGINESARAGLFLKMLNFPWEREICSAVKGLGRLGLPKAVIPLLNTMAKYRKNETITRAVVRALGNIRERRSFLVLESLLATSSGKLRKDVLLSLDRLTRLFYPSRIKNYLYSDDVKVREIAYRAASRLLKRKGEIYLAEGIKREKEESAILLILTWTKSVRTRELFDAVFSLALSSPSHKVRIMAGSVLRKTKSSRVLGFFKDLEPRASGRAKALILYFMADYGTRAGISEILTRNYNSSKDNFVRLIALESFGRFKSRDVIGFLKGVITDGNDFSYAASVSLAAIVDGRDWDVIAEMLSLKTEGAPAVIQVFLHLIHRLRAEHALPENINGLVIRLMDSPFRHIRYLAARCFAKIKVEGNVVRIVRGAQNDPSPIVRSAYMRSLVSVLSREPDELAQLLTGCALRCEIYPPYYGLFTRIETSQEGFEKIIGKLLKLTNDYIRKPPPKSQMYAARLMTLLKIQAMKQRSYFLNYLAAKDMSDMERWIMMRVINATDIHEFKGLDIDFMAGQYRTASPEAKLEYLNFFRKIYFRTRRIEEAVFQDLEKEKNNFIRKKIGEIVSSWITEAEKVTV